MSAFCPLPVEPDLCFDNPFRRSTLSRLICRFKICLLGLLVAGCVQPVMGCDLCSVYSAIEAQGEIGRGFFGGVAEQFTHFGTLYDEGHRLAGNGQYIDSSVAQVFAGYNFNNRFGLQLNVPVIYRAWGARGFHDGNAGMGDVSLLGTFNAYRQLAVDYNLSWNLLAGIKFPTGSASRLNTPDEALPEGIGGHDLALGSGSFDGVIGTGFAARYHHFLATANLQYAIRSEGRFHHQYANDLTWFAGPGGYLVLDDRYTLSLQLMFSGEIKDKDTFSGVPDRDSAETLVYAGPQFNLTWGSRLSAVAGIDIPLSRDNSGVQVLPDYRVRAAVSWRF
jgi:hypothetical protein